MEPTPFELTPKQKGLLESLARETGRAIPSLLDEALEGLQEHVHHRPVNGEPHGSDEHASPHRHTKRARPFGNASRTPAARFLTTNLIAFRPISPRRLITIFTARRNGSHAAFLC